MQGYHGERFCRPMCWIDLLLIADWQSGRTFYIRGNKIVVKRGEVVLGIRDIAKRWGMSVNTARARLKDFEREGKIDTQKSKIINRISIVNYEKYQGFDTQVNTQTDTQTDTQIDTPIKNNKNIKNITTTTYIGSNEIFQELFNRQFLLEQAFRSYHKSIDELKGIAQEVIANWELQNEQHTNLDEGVKHLLNTMRIILNKQQRNANITGFRSRQDKLDKQQAEVDQYLANKVARAVNADKIR